MTQILKHLLVLDLDETLIHSSVEKLTINEDFKYEEYFVYERPHLDWFIKEISNHFRLGIWSAADELYVSSIVKQIMPKDIKLEIMLDRTSCEIELDSETNTNTYEKNIAHLLQLDLKLEQIILVDDNAANAKINKGNVIVIKPFFGDLHDQELKFLYNYLLTIRDAEDIREIEEHDIERREDNVFRTP
jgi:RNA polymerase II subunit A small phosphatase-like protein